MAKKWVQEDNLKTMTTKFNDNAQELDDIKAAIDAGDFDVNKEKCGLGNVDNTSDMDKPVSNPQKQYIDDSVSEFLTSEDAAETLNESNLGIDPVVTTYIDDRVTEEVNTQITANYGIATETELGLVKASSDVEVADDGTMSVPELNTITNNVTTLDNRYNARMGALDNLVTSNKTNLVAAINETFQFGSEKKAKLVENLTARGITCSTNDSWETLLGYILTIK